MTVTVLRMWLLWGAAVGLHLGCAGFNVLFLQTPTSPMTWALGSLTGFLAGLASGHIDRGSK